jgi:hypothetical protein
LKTEGSFLLLVPITFHRAIWAPARKPESAEYARKPTFLTTLHQPPLLKPSLGQFFLQIPYLFFEYLLYRFPFDAASLLSLKKTEGVNLILLGFLSRN